MKKILIFAAAFMLISTLSFCQKGGEQGIVFETGTLGETLAKAKTQNKLVFVDVYASWCAPCRRMASEVFTQKKVGDYFNANFINAKFDAEQGEGVRIAERYNVDRYPTFLILDGDGALVGTLIGGSPADDFIARIQELVKRGMEDRQAQ